LYHQTAHLLGLRSDAATSPLIAHDALPPRPTGTAPQMELQLPVPNRVA
jgi:hypothetical protein